MRIMHTGIMGATRFACDVDPLDTITLTLTLKNVKSVTSPSFTGHWVSYGWGWPKNHPERLRQVQQGQLSRTRHDPTGPTGKHIHVSAPLALGPASLPSALTTAVIIKVRACEVHTVHMRKAGGDIRRVVDRLMNTAHVVHTSTLLVNATRCAFW